MSASTLLIMAGGTGGHIMPGLAVAETWRAQGGNVVWLGNPSAMEGRLVPPQGIPLQPLQFSGVRGKGVGTLVRLPWTLGRACAQARSALRQVRPDVVLGMGGYVAFPGGLAARLRGTPLVIHEQNAHAGLVNRVLARVAQRVLVGLPGGLNGTLVGNPVRRALLGLPTPEARMATRQGPLRLLVVGGSLGAQALNTTVPAALGLLRDRGVAAFTVRHQAGETHLPALRAAYAAAGVEADCAAFIDDMADAYAQADLVVCRAGAMTVAEVAAVGVAALFVPFPHAVDDHQTANARTLVDQGAGWLQDQAGLTPAGLADWLAQRTRTELLAVAGRARAQARPQAADDIVAVCRALVREEGA